MEEKKYIYGISLLILLISGYYITIKLYENWAYDAILENNNTEAISNLKFLSSYHYSKNERIRSSNIVINIYYSMNMKSEALQYAQEMVKRSKDNYHAHYHLGVYYWSINNVDKANFHLQYASIYPAYSRTYHQFIQWKEAKENTLGNIIKDIVVPSSIFDLLPIGKIRKLSKLSKLTKLGRSAKRVNPPTHISNYQVSKGKLKEYRTCLKRNNFSNKCDAIIQ